MTTKTISHFQADHILTRFVFPPLHVYLGEKPKEEKDKRKEDELVAVAKEVFSRRRFVTYVELAEEIQSILEVKERTAKSYIKFMREKEIILKSSDNQSYYVIGNF